MNPQTEILIQYIESQRKFEAVQSLAMGSEHIGAIVAETVLLPGLRYKSAVRPTIERLLKEYPEAKTTSEFVRTVEEISPKYFFNWTENDKPRRVLAVAKYLQDLGVETTDEFRMLFDEPDFPKALKEIRGVGNRHIDEFRLLLGMPYEGLRESALAFLNEAGIVVSSMDEAKPLLEEAAGELKLDSEGFLLCVLRYANKV